MQPVAAIKERPLSRDNTAQGTVEALSRASLQRPDVRAWCSSMVFLSTSVSIGAMTCGALILKSRQVLPEFLNDTCATANGLEVVWTGIRKYKKNHFAFPSTAASSMLIQVFANIIITLFLDAHARVNFTAMLWLLQKESGNGPRYNTNSRFLGGTKKFGPCHWTTNIVAAVAIAIGYGGAATLTARIHTSGICDKEFNILGPPIYTAWGVDISGYPLVMLGGALWVQSLISIWTLILIFGPEKKTIKTWSSDPVVNAVFMILTGGMYFADPRNHTQRPLRMSVYKQVSRVRWLVRVIWVAFAILATCLVITAYFAKQQGSFAIDQIQGDDWTGFGFVQAPIGPTSLVTDWAGVLIQSGMSGLLAFFMHCADVVAYFMNDDVSWQDAYSRYAEDPDAFVPKLWRFKWRNLVLFVAKSSIQWVFGYATSVDAVFTVSFVPLAVVTTIMLLVAITLETMARYKPHDGGPTTYGEFRLLIKYITQHHLIWL
ncbi:uncharacterized protein PV09_09445 [Verruconis gallopava]|uniref:Uncharacterized protein n=1 Tax=Verruconis gallopava TaxID=253628 RepID=A0A0D2AIN6_9PEZI|nr:uncharacterized protein PV09_09445 [Verruconis gallopava]KIV98793.1 hypothetical protein PV09_09445 [Verruconis gallopava]